MPVTFRAFWLFISVSTAAIFVLLIIHLVGIWPLYVSRSIRDQAEVVMLSLRNYQGIATSFFDLDSLRCDATSSCRMVLQEQWNSITAHQPLQEIHIVWQQSEPSKYSLTYDDLK
ncbi:MAG: hypothetical protein ABIB04_03170 [Patescibacteria group bacterium]